MAIKVGQLRKDLVQNRCLEDIKNDVTITTFQKENSEFSDLALALTGSWKTHDENNPKYNNTYYIKLKVKRINIYKDMGNGGDNDPHNLTVDVKLYQDANIKNQYQTISDAIYIEPYIPKDSSDSEYEKEEAFLEWCRQHLDPSESESPSGTEMLLPTQMVGYSYESSSSAIKVEEEDIPEDSPIREYYNELNQKFEEKTKNIDASQGYTNSEYEIVELVFTPYVNSNVLAFELRRVAYDYAEEPRILEIDWEASEVYKIQNILSVTAKKVGIQAKPGSLVVVNSAPMRVGKSGTLEIDVGIDITSIGFAAAGGERAIDDFIVDYIYEA